MLQGDTSLESIFCRMTDSHDNLEKENTKNNRVVLQQGAICFVIPPNGFPGGSAFGFGVRPFKMLIVGLGQSTFVTRDPTKKMSRFV